MKTEQISDDIYYVKKLGIYYYVRCKENNNSTMFTRKDTAKWFCKISNEKYKKEIKASGEAHDLKQKIMGY